MRSFVPTTLALPLASPRLVAHLPLLVVIWLLGLPLATLCVLVVLGLGAESPGPGTAAALLAIAAGLLAPAAWAVRRAMLLARPAVLRFHPGGLAIEYPEAFREPMLVPRDAIRVAAVDEDDDEIGARFRVHAASGPYGGGEDDVWLWSEHGSPLPVLPPDRGRPAVALLFDRPVAGPRLRRRHGGGVLQGERLAGVLLALREPEEARRALGAWSLLRPLTMPDLLALDELLGDAGDDPAEGARRALQRRGLARLGWGLVAVGLAAPLLAPLALFPARRLWRDGERRHPLPVGALAVVAVAAVRLGLYLG